MEFDTIIKQYWSQLILLLGAIGYLIRIFFNYRIKKKEIRFSKIEESKLLEIKSFLKAFKDLEYSVREYAAQSYFGDPSKDELKKLKNEILLKNKELELKSSYVKLFLPEEMQPVIDEVNEFLWNINKTVSRWMIYQKSKPPEDVKRQYDELYKTTIPEKLPTLIKKLEKELRSSIS